MARVKHSFQCRPLHNTSDCKSIAVLKIPIYPLILFGWSCCRLVYHPQRQQTVTPFKACKCTVTFSMLNCSLRWPFFSCNSIGHHCRLNLDEKHNYDLDTVLPFGFIVQYRVIPFHSILFHFTKRCSIFPNILGRNCWSLGDLSWDEPTIGHQLFGVTKFIRQWISQLMKMLVEYPWTCAENAILTPVSQLQLP